MAFSVHLQPTFFATITLVSWLLSASAAAAPTSRVTIAAAGSCPSAAELAQELRVILPSLAVSTVSDAVSSDTVVVLEGQAGVTVKFRDSQRYFADPAGRCAERASQAAVFVGLMLDPLQLPVTPEPAPAPKPRIPKPVPWRVDAGPSFHLATGFGRGTWPLALGGGVRLHQRRTLSFVAGAALLSTTTLHYERASARELLLPLDLGGRFTTAIGRWELGAELSFALAPAYVRGESVDRAKAGWRFEGGVRAAWQTTWWLGPRAGLFIAENALIWPHPIDLTVGGLGSVGKTPGFWLGAQLGVAVSID